MAYEQGDIVWAWIPYTNQQDGEYKTVIVVSTRPSNRGKDVTVAVLTGQIAKSRRRPRDYILRRWEDANLTEPRAMRPKVFVILKGHVGDRIGHIHDDDRPGMIACLKGLFGLE